MPMMSRMRDLSKWFFIIIGSLFILFMVISDPKMMEGCSGHTTNVGSINGKNISYQEFNQFVERARENQKAQTGKDIEEEQMDQFRDQVWEAIVSQHLTDQQMEKFGIIVTDKEIQETIMGPNPPEILKRGFTDSTGRFNREGYEQALRAPENKQPLIQAEEYVRQMLFSEKLQHCVQAAANVSEGELKRRFIDQNIKMTADFVLVGLDKFSDSAIKVSQDDLKKYYKDHPEKYKVEDQRKVKYVQFPIQATKADSSLVLQQFNSILERAKGDTTSFKSYVDIYSETPYSKDSMDISQLSPDFINAVSNVQPGSLVGPLLTPGGYALYKYYGTGEGKDQFVRASHILIQSQGNDAGALTQANSIYDQLTKGASFEEMARKFSKDPGSAVRGGDVGWFGKGRMVDEFANACFNGTIGQIQKPVKTAFGYHIIKVTGKTNKKYVVEKITLSIKPSAATKDLCYKNASDFAYLADKNSFEKEAADTKLKVEESQPFNENSYGIPGLGYNKGMVKFAFSNNNVSPVFKSGAGYVVLKVSETIKPGVKKFEEVEKIVKSDVIREMKYEKAKAMAELIKKEVGDDFSKASQLHNQAFAGIADQFTTAGNINGVGLDYNFAAEAYRAPLNKVIGPVKGVRGYYLIRVKERTNFDQAAYDAQRNGIRENLMNEKRQSLFSQWLAKLKEIAEVTDNRYKFYGQ